jgi:hypothetical protein
MSKTWSSDTESILCRESMCRRRGLTSMLAWLRRLRPPRTGAGDEIVRLVRDDARPQEIRVVTSDNTLINPVNAAGASVYRAVSFRNLIDPS